LEIGPYEMSSGSMRGDAALPSLDREFIRMRRDFRAANASIVVGCAYIGAPVASFHANDAVMRLRGQH